MDTKVCTKCGIEKPLDLFPKNKNKKDGKNCRCKLCMKDYYSNVHKKVYENNKEFILKQHKEWRENNKEHIKEYKRKYNMNHKKKLCIQRQKNRKEKGYSIIHQRTEKFILKNNLRPIYCSICGAEGYTEFHHPDYSKCYEGLFVCRTCHSGIHLGKILQYNIVNLLDLIPPLDNNN